MLPVSAVEAAHPRQLVTQITKNVHMWHLVGGTHAVTCIVGGKRGQTGQEHTVSPLTSDNTCYYWKW